LARAAVDALIQNSKTSSHPFEIVLFAFFSSRLAQTNSLPRIANPSGITITAGPGKTNIAIPMRRTVNPTTITISRRACFKVLITMVFMNESVSRLEMKYDTFPAGRNASTRQRYADMIHSTMSWNHSEISGWPPL
jgi:hypothetical protein